LAITGVVAGIAYYGNNKSDVQSPQNFLYNPISETEYKFIDFISKFKRSY
jgi:hypothetical protein